MTKILIIAIAGGIAVFVILSIMRRRAAISEGEGGTSDAAHSAGPDALTVSDWLKNTAEAAVGIVQSENLLEQHSARRIALYVEVCALQLTDDVLHLVPGAVSATPRILKEARLYFNSIWQLFLLSRFEDHRKVQFLFPLVEQVETSFWSMVFESNSRVKGLLGQAIIGTTRKDLKGAIATYI